MFKTCFINCLCIFPLFIGTPIHAQIIPDQSLQNNSLVNKKGNLINITGGTKENNNLFHSFKEFSVSKNQEVNINTIERINNIFARVTGNKTSFIDGKINVNSNSNLFFFNSNGITLLSGAKFNSPASITLSTSPLVKFNNSSIFNTSNPSFIIPKSSTDFSIDLKNSTAIRIINKGSATTFNNTRQPQLSSLSSTNNSPDILFDSQGAFNLIGNQIELDGAVLNSYGDINLFSGRNGVVEFIGGRVNKVSQGYEPSNINLLRNSLIESIGSPVGKIKLEGNHINLKDTSVILSSNFGGSEPGIIEINGNQVKLEGIRNIQDPGLIFSGIVSQNFNGKGADIKVKSSVLDLQKFSSIVSINDGPGQSGDINIDSTHLSIDGTPPSSFRLSSITSTQIQGLSGKIYLKGSTLKLCCGAQVNSQNASFSPTRPLPGGDITVGFNSILIDGKAIASTSSNQNSILFDEISSSILTSALVNGNSGNIIIDSENIRLSDSGSIVASNSGLGSAGYIQINSDDIVILGNPDARSLLNQTKVISSSVKTSPLLQDLFQLSNDDITGDSGDLDINAKSLKLFDRGVIGVLNEGTGDSGTINIKSELLDLNNATISANTNGGNGGLININSDKIFLNSGNISSSSKKLGVGGNINIFSKLLASRGKSKVLANAENSQAGNISIVSGTVIVNNTEISASSNLGANSDGEVSITQRENELRLIDAFPEVENSLISINTQCNTGSANAIVTNHGLGKSEVGLSEKQQKALYLKQRIDFASQFHYIDSDSGEKRPYKPLLAIEENEGGSLELIFSPEQSQGLQNLLSSLDNICQIKS